jgi:nitroreductase
MELKDVIYKRQSIRRFKAGDIPNADLREILDAARVAPSGKNLQNWHYIVIKNKELMGKISAAIVGRNEEICLEMDKVDKAKADRFRKFVKYFTVFFTEAPVLVVVMTETYSPSGYRELELIGADPLILDDIRARRSPGMQSLGASIENLYLRAIDLGYGLCWLTSANYAAAAIEDIVCAETGFDKEGYFMGALLVLGVPEEGAKSPPKKNLDDIYTLIE